VWRLVYLGGFSWKVEFRLCEMGVIVSILSLIQNRHAVVPWSCSVMWSYMKGFQYGEEYDLIILRA